MKIISSKIHGFLDYLTVIFLALSPMLFHMEGELKNFTYGLAAVHLLLTILTRFEGGLIKIIPFRIHGFIELLVAIALIGVSFWFAQHDDTTLGYYYYIWLALVILVVFLLTDFNNSGSTGN